jgi:hypothetical protein
MVDGRELRRKRDKILGRATRDPVLKREILKMQPHEYTAFKAAQNRSIWHTLYKF